MQTQAAVLERIQPLSKVEGYLTAEVFLQHPGTHLHQGGTDGRVTVKQADHAWGTRLELARKKGLQPVPGCEHLVSALNKLPAETILEAVIFEGEGKLGAFWFVEQTGDPVGFIVGAMGDADQCLGHSRGGLTTKNPRGRRCVRAADPARPDSSASP